MQGALKSNAYSESVWNYTPPLRKRDDPSGMTYLGMTHKVLGKLLTFPSAPSQRKDPCKDTARAVPIKPRVNTERKENIFGKRGDTSNDPPLLLQVREQGGPAFFFHLGISSPSGSHSAPTQENLSGANIAPLLLFQKTLEIYSVELNGTKDVNQTDQGDDKKFKEMKNKDSEPNKGREKEELKKELDLVSPLKAKGPGAPCH